MEIIALLLASALVALQAFATLRVRRSVAYAPDQKWAQIRLIWLLPLLGAALVLSVLHQDGELMPRRGTSSQGDRG
ncbi:MAG TPA: hypothetical protein VFS43_46075 [Polyangiaceae bacterium]|nr:hypothetical protein [Polyangiaceae bacterium]